MTADEASHKDAPGRVHLKASDYDTDFYWSVDQVLDPDIWPYVPGSAGRGSPSPQLGPGPPTGAKAPTEVEMYGNSLRLALASPVLAGSVHCTTYEEKTLGRLQTLCGDGTRAMSTYNRTLDR